jgi:hypothetical protein
MSISYTAASNMCRMKHCGTAEASVSNRVQHVLRCFYCHCVHLSITRLMAYSYSSRHAASKRPVVVLFLLLGGFNIGNNVRSHRLSSGSNLETFPGIRNILL